MEPEQQPGPGQIRDSNRDAMLCAAVESAGDGVPIDLGIASDNPAAAAEQMIMGFTAIFC
ncbi:MAG: hypothetical protein R2867_09590 [Caldilineaceae bacterium]